MLTTIVQLIPTPSTLSKSLRSAFQKGKSSSFVQISWRCFDRKIPFPCGATDSGKTILFSAVFQIVPLSRMARVAKQKSFNKATFNSSAEVIFLGEAHRELLDIDDWKII